jgi:VWFA-related protein
MRVFFLTMAGVLLGLLLTTGAWGDGETPPTGDPVAQYTVDIDQQSVVAATREGKAGRALYVTLQFKVTVPGGRLAPDLADEDIVVEEDGKPVEDLELFRPRVGKLTTVLAMDISGSMSGKTGGGGRTKIEEAKAAAHKFLDSLHDKADSGLVLFDHLMRVEEKPSRDPKTFAEHRKAVRKLIDDAKPGGGTAYLDAASEAIRMIKPIGGRRAVLVMTDGVDMNSKKTLDEVISEAKAVGVPVYTLGVGDPGKKEPVTTVLVLDHSESMKAKASDTDELSKMEALRKAASRFTDLMRHGATMTVLPFSSKVETPERFSEDRRLLERRIERLQPEGGTLLYDATYAGIETLMASQAVGKKAVVVLTDGKDEDPGSRVSDQVVIDRAKEAKIPLYMLGLGRHEEINEEVMQKMATQTGGKYYHAGSQQQLIDLFEQLSIDIHDEGIDEESLRKLAEGTGGKYVPVRDASQLQFEFAKLSEELQSTFTATFPSRRQSHDGTARGIRVAVSKGGREVSTGGLAEYNVRGVVVPDMDYRIYLVLLLLLGGLLLAPAMLRRSRGSSPEA